MLRDNNKDLPIAHLANEFALNGKVDFNNAREWIIFLYLVAQLNPSKQDELPPEAIIHLSDLKRIIAKDGRSGGLYNEIRSATKRMAKVVCEFDSEVSVEGQILPSYVPIFSAIGAKKSKEGSIYISYEFNDKMTPLLLGFRRNFLNIQLPQGITSAHAIRFLLYAKAERDRRQKEGAVTKIRFEIDELKKLLRIEGKYNSFKNLRVRVLEPIQDGINASGILEMPKMEYYKTGRSITSVEFHVSDAKRKIGVSTRGNDLSKLTFAQDKALTFLTEKGIYEDIAINKILKNMPSSVCDGYEDYFCEEIYKIVEEKSTAKDEKGRAAVLVSWFNKDIFSSDQFSRIIENVHARKKELSQEKQDNRAIAMKMTSTAFKEWYKNRD